MMTQRSTVMALIVLALACGIVLALHQGVR
jgi:hypothetical protein